MLKVCTSKNVCNTCHKKHHSLLHFDIKSHTSTSQVNSNKSQLNSHSSQVNAPADSQVVASAQHTSSALMFMFSVLY